MKGFTLLEVIVSTGIIVLIGTLSLVSFVNSRNVRDLTAAGQEALSILHRAEESAAAGEDNSPWGVHLEQYRMVLFRGAAYGGAAATTSYPLPATIEIVDIALGGGGQDVIFTRPDGKTSQSGTFVVRVRGSSSQIFPVTILASGNAYRTGTAPVSSGTRIVDTRHRAYTLGWPIKNSVTMMLSFNDTELVYLVTMATYFNADKTKFDWSGTVNVGGQNQTLRIHTVLLTDTDTILDVDRDCRKNTKQVKITIDAREIVTEKSDCRTVIMGAFGGTMSEL